MVVSEENSLTQQHTLKLILVLISILVFNGDNIETELKNIYIKNMPFLGVTK